MQGHDVAENAGPLRGEHRGVRVPEHAQALFEASQRLALET